MAFGGIGKLTTGILGGGGSYYAGNFGSVLNPLNDTLNTSRQSMASQTQLGPASGTEQQAEQTVQDEVTSLQRLLRQDPRTQEFNQLQGARRSFATTLGEYGQGQFLPTGEDISYSNRLAANLFGAQRQAMQFDFENQTMQSNRMASSLGRDTSDPILQSQLRRGFMQQSSQLNAQQGAFAQQLAMQMPQQRLAYQEQSLGVLESILGSEDALAQRAQQNRMALLGIGQQIMTQQQNFRLGAAGKTVTGTNTGTAFDTLGGMMAVGGKLSGAGM